MSNVASGAPIVLLPSTPTIKRLTITLANTFETYSLPANTKAVYIYNKTSNIFEWNFDGSVIDYLTIEKGAFHYEENKNMNGKTLYIRSDTALDVVEIISWA